VSKSRFLRALGPGRENPGPPDDGTEPAGAPGAPAGLSRRVFLIRTSLAAGAVAAVGSVPGLGGLLSSAEVDSSDMAGATSAATTAAAISTNTAEAEIGAGAETSGPLVAHIVNATTGEINLYQGTVQIVAHNPGLAQALARLAAGN